MMIRPVEPLGGSDRRIEAGISELGGMCLLCRNVNEGSDSSMDRAIARYFEENVSFRDLAASPYQ